MNIEETVSKLAESQTGQDARLVRLEAAFQQVAQSLQLLIEMTATHEERHDAHDEARIHADARLDALIDSQIKLGERFDAMTARTDARLDALIDAQVRYEARQERLEEAFRQVGVSHQMLIQLVGIQEERIDGHDQAQRSTDARFDALIDAQIGLDERIARLATAQSGHRRQAEERHARLDEKLSQLAAAQARSDERINELFNKNGH